MQSNTNRASCRLSSTLKTTLGFLWLVNLGCTGLIWASGPAIIVGCPLDLPRDAAPSARDAERPTKRDSNRQNSRPNIILILADDLGYGDVGCYNPNSKIPTPNLDRLAAQGIRFTDAHSPSTVCTPTRYGLLTGQMPFRIPRGSTVFQGADGPSLISSSRLTLPKMLRQQGYATACTGKWHLGVTFYDQAGRPIHDGRLESIERIDFDRAIDGGPLDHGFDHFFGTANCPTTDWLYSYIDGNRIPVPPTQRLDKSQLPKHAYSHDNRAGWHSPGFDLEEVDMFFLEKSRSFLRDQVRERPEQPFFLYHSMQAVHLPSFPADQFKGKTGLGAHADFIFQLDFIVGELLDEIESLQIADNTLVIFTSDNGPEVPTVLEMRKTHQHDGASPWRGMKRDGWEGGHRVPLLVRWPSSLAAATSDELVSLTDVMATVAEVVGFRLPADAAEDSFSFLPVLLHSPPQDPVRPYLLQQAFGGKRHLSIRRGAWKYLAHQGSGGNNYANNRGLQAYELPEHAPEAAGQLYNLVSDPGETTNLALTHPEIVEQLSHLLQQSIDQGRSRPLPEDRKE